MTKKILLILFAFLLILPCISAVNITSMNIDNLQYNAYTNFSSFADDSDGLSMCWMELGYNDIFFNSTYTLLSGNESVCYNFSKLYMPVGYNITYRWYSNDSSNEVNMSEMYFITRTQEQGLSLSSCPNNTGLAIVLLILSLIAVFLLYISIASSNYIISMLCSLLIIILGFYISPCLSIYGFILSLIGVVLFFWSSIKGWKG